MQVRLEKCHFLTLPILFCSPGFIVSRDTAIAKIDPKSITPQVFFEQYVAERKPVVFTELIPGFVPSEWVQ